MTLDFHGVTSWLKSKFATLNREDCADIVSDALISIYENYRDKPASEQRSLLRTICFRKANDFKKNGIHFTKWNESSEFIATNDECWNTDANWAHLRKLECLYQEVEKLDWRDRMLMTMYLEQTPVREIAARLGYTSEQAVRNRKHVITSRMSKVFSGQDSCPLFLCCAA